MDPDEITAALERGKIYIEWDNDDLYVSVDTDETGNAMKHVCVGRMYSFVGEDSREILRVLLRECVALAILNAESEFKDAILGKETS